MGINLSEVNLAYSKIKKEYHYAIRDINLHIDNNDEFVAIVGHTGSGKSTLVQALNCLLVPTYGNINISFLDGDKDIYYRIQALGKKTKYSVSNSKDIVKYRRRVNLKALRRHIGLVFQFPEYQLFEETVLKDIMFGPKNFYKDEAKAKEEALKISDMMGLNDLLDKSPFLLSGGQMRKVAIAGILASNPDILVLDEPTVGLDPIAKRELLEFLKFLNEKEHKTIIIITHDMDVVGSYAKRVIVLNSGEIKFDGEKADLFKRDDIISTCHLSYPNTIKIVKELNKKLNLDMDIYQYNIDDVCKELSKALGGTYE